MDSRPVWMAKSFAKLCGAGRAAVIAACVLYSTPPSAGEIIVGPARGPGLDNGSLTAREARQRAAIEGRRGEFEGSANIIIIDGVNGATPTGTPAANGAAYNRRRANANRTREDGHPAESVIVIPTQGTINSHSTAEGQSAHDNRSRSTVYRKRDE
jgi:hypothetical protein